MRQKVTSLWQSDVQTILIRTSYALGGSTTISSMASGSPAALHTAAARRRKEETGQRSRAAAREPPAAAEESRNRRGGRARESGCCVPLHRMGWGGCCCWFSMGGDSLGAAVLDAFEGRAARGGRLVARAQSRVGRRNGWPELCPLYAVPAVDVLNSPLLFFSLLGRLCSSSCLKEKQPFVQKERERNNPSIGKEICRSQSDGVVSSRRLGSGL